MWCLTLQVTLLCFVPLEPSGSQGLHTLVPLLDLDVEHVLKVATSIWVHHLHLINYLAKWDPTLPVQVNWLLMINRD